MIERGTDFSQKKHRSLWPVVMLALLLVGSGLACSLGSLVAGSGAGAPTPARELRPTFTPWPGQPTRPPLDGDIVRGGLPPGVTAVAPTLVATPGRGSTAVVLFATSSPTPAPTGVPTRTPRPTVTFTPVPTVPPTATPFVVVNSATVNGRRGPGTIYELVGQAQQGQQLMILGKSEDGSWWLVCCISNQPTWVAADRVSPNGSLEFVPLVTAAPTEIPTPAPPPTLTPTPQPTRPPPFDIGEGPVFPIQRDTGVLTIWVKVFEGPVGSQRPVAGYMLKVFRDGVDVSLPDQSHNRSSGFDSTQPEGNFQYNLKFEMYRAGEAAWEIYLARPSGERVSPVTKFTTLGDSYRNQVVYIAYWLAR